MLFWLKRLMVNIKQNKAIIARVTRMIVQLIKQHEMIFSLAGVSLTNKYHNIYII